MLPEKNALILFRLRNNIGYHLKVLMFKIMYVAYLILLDCYLDKTKSRNRSQVGARSTGDDRYTAKLCDETH